MPANPIAEVSGSAVLAKLTRRLLPFLFLLYVVAYLDRINVGFAKLQMSGQLHFSEAVYGFAAGLFFAGYFCFQLPSNLILAKLGARRWISVIMLAWGAISASMMFVTTPRSFYILRFLLGIAEAGFFPGMIFYLRSWFPAASRARAVALFATAGPLSGVIGGPLSGAILSYHPTSGLAGWQWLFLLEGIPAMVLGGVVFLSLADEPRRARWLSAEECSWLEQTLRTEEVAAGSASLGTSAPWWSIFFDPSILLLGLVYFCLNTTSYGISLWLPSVLSSLASRTNFAIGVLSAIPYLVAAGGMVVVGNHSDRTGERRWHVAGCALVAAGALTLAAFSASTIGVVAGLSFAMFGVSAMVGPFWTLSSTLLSGLRASAGIAVINSIGNLGGFVGPNILGLTRSSSGNFRNGLLVLAGGMVLGAGVALSVRMDRAGENRR